jgi:hypothetical protein
MFPPFCSGVPTNKTPQNSLFRFDVLVNVLLTKKRVPFMVISHTGTVAFRNKKG